MRPPQTVAVTGAAGTVGGYVVDVLRQSGYRVIAIDRSGTVLPEADVGLEVRRGDLTDDCFCDACLQGADHIIHTAALIDIALDYDELKPINVDAVTYLYEAARRYRLRTFIHFSSGSIYDHQGHLIGEDTPLRGTSPYETSKIESEEVLKAFHGKGGPAYVILRPSLIYGPRGRLLGAPLAAVPPILFMFTGSPCLGFVGGPRLNWVHGEDVARAAVYCMENDNCWGETFNVADDTPLPIADALNATTRAYGLELGTHVPIPPKWFTRMFYRVIDTDFFFQALNGATGPLWTMVRSRYDLLDELQVKVDRATATYFVRDVIFDNSKLRRAGFDFRWPDFRQGIGEVVRWYQEHNWVPQLEQKVTDDVASSWGFQFRQNLKGTFSTIDGRLQQKPLEFSVTGRAANVRQFTRDNLATLRGTVTLQDWATQAPLTGVLEAALLTRGAFLYDFDFEADDGTPCRLRGIEQVDLGNLLETMTTMELEVTDQQGKTLARGRAHFDLRQDLLQMLSSFRPRY
jgi:nucleoside-diphosphate-sugar epimerase